jgi:UDP-glucose 4-epimerase
MKCVVLGGLGFLGSQLGLELLRQGHDVRLFDRPHAQPALPVPTGDVMGGDFANREDLAVALEGCEVVYHLVCTTLPASSNENPLYDVETNLVSTIRLLEVARAMGTRKIVFDSSGGTIYGVPRHIPVPEDHPTDPLCSYAIHKLAIEKFLHLYAHLHGLDYAVLRVANPYGEGQSPLHKQGAVAVFTYKALRGEAIQIWGDGEVVRDYLYVGDVADAFVRAATYTGPHRIFNIGAGCGYSLNQLLARLEALLGRDIKRTYLPGRPFDAPVSILDIRRARAELDWSPQTMLETGLARTAEWLRKAFEIR